MPLRHRRDRQARIYTGIGRNDGTIADEEVLVAEHPMLAVDHAVLGCRSGDRTSEYVCGEWHVEQRFGEPTLCCPTGPVGQSLGNVVGYRQEGRRRVARILAGGEPEPPARYPSFGHE